MKSDLWKYIVVGITLVYVFTLLPQEEEAKGEVPATPTELTLIEEDVRVEPVEEVQQEETQINRYEVYPVGVEERKDAIQQEFLYLGMNPELIFTMMEIARRESIGTFSDTITPPVWVKHCKRPNGSYYAVEIDVNRKQAYCGTGDVETKKERSIGMFQILPSTFKAYNCEGDINNWKDQVKCAKVLTESKKGLNHWVAYQKMVKGQ